jgi:adenosylmethionine-8-amino-7-oxononanoate aminotransferase
MPGLRGLELLKRLFAAGLHVKMTGDTCLLSPPLIAEETDIEEICSITRSVLGEL